MSYGILKSFKKEESQNIFQRYSKHVVVGNDLIALKKFHDLIKEHGEENVLIISSSPIDRDSLMPMGPSFLRGQEEIKFFKEQYPNAISNDQAKSAKFLKEGELRDFGGRSKPEKLLWSEEFFTQESIDVDYKALFPFLNDEEFFDIVKSNTLEEELVSISPKEPNDLVDPINFKLVFGNGLHLGLEKLYWAENPYDFVEKFTEKSKLSNGFISYCDRTNGPGLLTVRFELKEEVLSERDTLFIPLSYTHDWGHFIGEFKNDEEGGAHFAEFISFVDKSHTSEEDISKKIRLFKRNLEKIAPDLKKNIVDEYISLREYSACSNLDREGALSPSDHVDNLRLLGENALVDLSIGRTSCEYSLCQPSHLLRSLLSLQ